MVAESNVRMTTHAIVVVDEFELDGEDELKLDRLPGMPLVGFFTGAVISLSLWGVLGYVAWHLVA